MIEHRGSQFFLRDCSSANGSVVNGDRVSERGLRDGDLVAIGSMRLLFREEPVEAGAGGKVVPHPSAAPFVCPSCGGEYRRGDLFCRECGAQVAAAERPPEDRLRLVRDGGAAARPFLQRLWRHAGLGRPARGGARAGERRPRTATRNPCPSSRTSRARPAPRARWRWLPDRKAAPRRAPAPAAEGAPAASRGAVAAPRAAARSRAARRLAAPAEPARRLAAFVVDAVVRALRPGGPARARRLVLVGPGGPADAVRRVLPAGARLGDPRPARAPAGRALPRLLLEREGRHPGQGAPGPAGRDGGRRLAPPPGPRDPARLRLPPLAWPASGSAS